MSIYWNYYSIIKCFKMKLIYYATELSAQELLEKERERIREEEHRKFEEEKRRWKEEQDEQLRREQVIRIKGR